MSRVDRSIRFGMFALVLAGVASLAIGCNSSVAKSAPGAGGKAPRKPPITIDNVSYDPTRELYAEFNPAFASYWKEKTGQDVTINQRAMAPIALWISVPGLRRQR